MALSLDDAQSWLASIARGGRGVFVRWPARVQPAEPLELYEFESCPFCRKVREVLSEMDLDYISRACPKGAVQNRGRATTESGKALFPFLVDPNTGRALHESEDIIDYLHRTYGEGRPTLSKVLAPATTVTSAVASLVRSRGGALDPRRRDRPQPPQLLELWNFEGSPYCRKAREKLCALGLDYRVHNVAKGGSRRAELVARGGRMMVPYLVDPNEDIAMYESDDIVAWLDRTYGAAA
ncbi:MAG: glutathione S-transferase N-terminal domain-containing protein [Deltaproteobacteria bacterium]|nr:glutathione S-transferase N-terminal domain-containing protein [Deltaproteobacteria bacterium]MCB9786630.1 glutathione S-transferase N-terminal domain-containing protein [Deltaproteobacteria bacterium]